MLLVGILPSLGKATVVPEDGPVVVAELALLDVLGDGVGRLLGGNLHLGLGVLGDFSQHVVDSSLSSEREVVPGGDLLAAGLEVEAVALGADLAADLGLEVQARDGRRHREAANAATREGGRAGPGSGRSKERGEHDGGNFHKS